jgi:hypothetical protein
MQEVLLVIAIGFALFALPRLMGRRPEIERATLRQRVPALTGRTRLAILATLVWLAGTAVFLAPWESGDVLPLLSLGVAPAALLWGAAWVWLGFRKYRR